MQLRIWARLEDVDGEQFTHPVSSVEEAKSLLSALPRFYDWSIDPTDAPDLLAGLEERDDEDDDWTTWLDDHGRGIWDAIRAEVAQALEEDDE